MVVSDSFLVVVLDGIATARRGVPATTAEVCVLSIPSPHTFPFVVIFAGVVATRCRSPVMGANLRGL